MAVRYVAAQPLKFESEWNVRKLMELPEHIIKCGDLQVLKDEVLCNLHWLLAKLKATSYRYN